MPTRPTERTIERLFAVSGNQCAFPGCTANLVIGDTVTAEICHIKAQNAGEAENEKVTYWRRAMTIDFTDLSSGMRGRNEHKSPR
jgi:hypothetical protein